MSLNDDLIFAPEESAVDLGAQLPPWKMLIVDDEIGVHDVTRLALKGFQFQGRQLELLSTYSAQEAKEILTHTPDIAVILLDVVMESDHAGLSLARDIRESMGLSDLRIVLRTGQPGQAPEREVILAYDINDYRAKTELTSDRLFTTVVSALRSYQDICALNDYRTTAYQFLGDQQRREEQILAMIDVPVFSIDLQGCFTSFNPAFLSTFNLSGKDLIGTTAPTDLAKLISELLNSKPENNAPELSPVEWNGFTIRSVRLNEQGSFTGLAISATPASKHG